MNDNCALLPWEYRGSGADLRAHATIPALEVGGKKRRLLLKQRDGVVYFKDADENVAFAILRRFENDLSAFEMVEAVRESVAQSSHGRFLLREHYFGGRNPTKLCIIIQMKSGCGWLKEWFDPDWFSFSNCFQPQSAIEECEPRLIGRAMNPQWRNEIPMQWVVGSQPQYKRMTDIVSRVLIPIDCFDPSKYSNAHIINQAHSPLGRGGLNSLPPFYRPEITPVIKPLINVHFVMRGLKWHQWAFDINNDGEDAIIEAKRNLEIWGENWRMMWIATPHFFQVDVPLSTAPTAHERLEAALELREWLQNKLPEPEIDNLLRDALN